jgi:serine protease inhibitor ecotin
MKKILAIVLSTFLFASFANAATTCADLTKDFDAKVKTAKLDKTVTEKVTALRKAAGDAAAAKKEADCVKSINEAFKVAGLKAGAAKKEAPMKDAKEAPKK